MNQFIEIICEKCGHKNILHRIPSNLIKDDLPDSFNKSEEIYAISNSKNPRAYISGPFNTLETARCCPGENEDSFIFLITKNSEKPLFRWSGTRWRSI
jgi:hypothetical protein